MIIHDNFYRLMNKRLSSYSESPVITGCAKKSAPKIHFRITKVNRKF